MQSNMLMKCVTYYGDIDKSRLSNLPEFLLEWVLISPGIDSRCSEKRDTLRSKKISRDNATVKT